MSAHSKARDSLSQRILDNGVENVRFFIPVRPMRGGFIGIGWTDSSDETSIEECIIDEHRYKVEDDYKITLRPVNQDYAYEHFYLMDLESLMRENPSRFRMEVKATVDA